MGGIARLELGKGKGMGVRKLDAEQRPNAARPGAGRGCGWSTILAPAKSEKACLDLTRLTFQVFHTLLFTLIRNGYLGGPVAAL